ncbi:TPA: type II secretion system F family protein [Proteus mirabilis]|uniref:type II secretion system F family protein n=1 Tax=Proteus TaxID=583 RepID=UPI00053863D7|nr:MULTISPECIES: type II secretion system F family protein [Proteus]AUU13559.1 transporter [Proteus mirabilis]EKT8507434.1 type II secretion system F family protein [Proteus mirabilis]EKU7865351.1 type II secretion system F family protein [Proteus mirabilis]EKU7880402.1 type II secretion system F family protein [Proteus mirabilis]ELA7786061.1 type II secretion system F family protein [Proteus mirabilis]
MKLHFIYRYNALTYQGKWLSGNVVAQSKHEVIDQLIQQQKLPVKIRLYRVIIFQNSDKQYRIQLLEQLALLLHSGLALLPALTLLKEECRYLHWQCVLNDIIFHLNQGGALSKQLSRYPLYFPANLTHFIYIGEESGKLDEVLLLQTTQLKNQRDLIKKIIKAFQYPLFLLLTLIVITISMLSYVLPEYQSLYSAFNTELPTLTLTLIRCSQWFSQYSLIILLFILIISYSYYTIKHHNAKFRDIEQRCWLNLPYLGILLRYHQLHIIFQIMTITQQAGLPLLQGLKIITEQLTHSLYQRALTDMIAHITQGKSLSSFMRHNPLFPPICYQFISSAENSGQLQFFCQQLTHWFYHQLEERLDSVKTWLEPILMTLIALITGTLIIAMYLPVLQLGDTIH